MALALASTVTSHDWH